MTIALDPLMTWVVIIGALVVLGLTFLLGRRYGARRALRTMRHSTHSTNLSD